MTRKRKTQTYNLDSLIIEKLLEISKDNNKSASRYLEELLFAHLKLLGRIPISEQELGETRGSYQRKT